MTYSKLQKPWYSEDEFIKCNDYLKIKLECTFNKYWLGGSN